MEKTSILLYSTVYSKQYFNKATRVRKSLEFSFSLSFYEQEEELMSNKVVRRQLQKLNSMC